MKILSSTKQNNGFAMLFTVLVVSIILAIGVGISNLAFKQTVLSSLAKDSQIAFYQADAAAECGLYYELTIGLFPRGTTVGAAPGSILCGSKTLIFDTAGSFTDFLVYKEAPTDTTKPCMSVVFNKADSPTQTTIAARGYNVCAVAPRQVERGLQIRF